MLVSARAASPMFVLLLFCRSGLDVFLEFGLPCHDPLVPFRWREAAKRRSNNTESEHDGRRVGRGGILSSLIFMSACHFKHHGAFMVLSLYQRSFDGV